jgi:hypothetical protein
MVDGPGGPFLILIPKDKCGDSGCARMTSKLRAPEGSPGLSGVEQGRFIRTLSVLYPYHPW